MNIKTIAKLISAILICQLAGAIGSLITISSVVSFYNTLNKPSFAPPSWLFGPVWITLYALMGISLYLVWNQLGKNKQARISIIIFAIQLAINTIWTYLFFGLQSPFYGLVGIIALWIAIAITIINFLKVSRKAAYLLIPYIIWVTIAMVLNYYILILNP